MRTSRLTVALAALLLPAFVTTTSGVAAPARERPALGPSAAVAANVRVANMTFSPTRVVVRVGETVTWTFVDAISHTATSNQGFFNTRAASGGVSRSVRFLSAGTFPYHCSFHPTMVGRVAVPVTVTGSRADGWKLRWRVGTNPKNRSYDVQVRRKGTKTWTYLRRDTTAATARFVRASGTWQVRARTLKGAAKSGWSPVVTFS